VNCQGECDEVYDEAEERGYRPAAYTEMRLTPDEAAALEEWFKRATPHPEELGARLPLRIDAAPSSADSPPLLIDGEAPNASACPGN